MPWGDERKKRSEIYQDTWIPAELKSYYIHI